MTLKALADARRVPLSHDSNGVLGKRCRSVVEAGLYAVSASATLVRIDPSPATARALAAMREMAGALAARLAATAGSLTPIPNLEELECAAFMEATRPEIDASTQLLLTGVLKDFRSLEGARAALDIASASPEDRPASDLTA